MNLWHKTKKPNAAYGKKIYAPVRGIERLRIQTDGEGVRTLIALNHCMLNCRYCINKQHINVFPFYKKVSVEQLGSMIEKDAVYFEMSNGGVTFGGGEPLLYADFIQAFHQQYPEWNIDVQTSLNVLAYDVEKLIDVVDVWHIDVKDMNPRIYELYTGCSNENVIHNLKMLCTRIPQCKIRVRVPHIPKYHCDKDIVYSVQVLREMGIENIEEFDYMVC